MHAVRIHGIEAVEVLQATLCAEAVPLTLARHPALLPGDGGEILVLGRGDRLREAYVERLRRQVEPLISPVAELHVVAVEPASEFAAGLEQRPARLLRGSADAAVHPVRDGDQAPAAEEPPHL